MAKGKGTHALDLRRRVNSSARDEVHNHVQFCRILEAAPKVNDERVLHSLLMIQPIRLELQEGRALGARRERETRKNYLTY